MKPDRQSLPRTGLFVIRLRREGAGSPMVIRLTARFDAEAPTEVVKTVSSVAEACATIQRWFEVFEAGLSLNPSSI